MEVLKLDGVTKHYPAFTLDHVSFSVRPGTIMGFIGRNGAGKTTTLKSLMNYVHPDAGHVSFFGLPFDGNEAEIKARIGYVSGGVDYYPRKKLRQITNVTRPFYPTWDEAAYRRYMELFSLDDSKRVSELSAGMKVKYQLALALSHRAELLILDEPTSGLDPVSRDDLLEVFLDLVEQDGVSILFSTHITSDLEKCADDITYIRQGRILYSGSRDAFTARYRKLTGQSDQLTSDAEKHLIGLKRHAGVYSAMVRVEDVMPELNAEVQNVSLEEAMIFLERM